MVAQLFRIGIIPPTYSVLCEDPTTNMDRLSITAPSNYQTERKRHNWTNTIGKQYI